MKKTIDITAKLITTHSYLNETIDHLKGCEDSQEVLKLAQSAEQAVDELLVGFKNATTFATFTR